MTVLVFENKVKADAVMNEIAVTPFGSVWTWSKVAEEVVDTETGEVIVVEPESTVNDIQYATDATGRCAIAHNFSEEDRAWLEIYLEGIVGVQILDALPSDWQYPTDI